MTDLYIDDATSRQYQQSLASESDRGCVLVTIAMLDELCRQIAEEELSRGNKEVLRRLLDPPMGYLSGFMAKVDLLFAMGVISAPMYRDVVSINRLRNECAHTRVPFRFTEEIYNKSLRDIAGAKLSQHLADNDWHYLPDHVVAKPAPDPWRNKCESALVATLIIYNIQLSGVRKRAKDALPARDSPSAS